ncbi:MAG: condensation domain-containing protein, partial [Calditrichia bacterium]
MSNAPLTELLAAGLQLWRKGEQLGFKAPRGKMQPELRDRLVAAKPHLLEELQEGCRYSLCSFAQQRLWFLEQLEGASPVYNVNGGLKIEGTLNTAAFRKSLQAVVQRHQAFRTAFRDEKGTPYQMIFDEINVELPVVDLTSYGDNAENELRNLMRAKSNEVFVLDQAPLIKTVLYKISEEHHVLFFMTHHIVFDGWSSGIVLRELSHLYESETKGIESSLQPLEVDYSDHVIQQRNWFEGAEASRQLDYWNEKLAGELPVLEMPADKPRPAMQSTRGEMMFNQLSGDLITKLHERAREENVSLFMLLLAASNILLARYTNQQDILLGMPVANRKNKDLENIVGFFANTLVLRNDMTGNPTFSELLQRTRETTLQALNHEDTPFEQIVESLRPERDLSRTPIFQAMISYEEDHLSNDFFGDLQTTALHVESQISRTDLTFWFYHGEGYLNVKLEYCIDLFNSESAERWMQSFETLLNAIAVDTSVAISELPVMPAQEE